MNLVIVVVEKNTKNVVFSSILFLINEVLIKLTTQIINHKLSVTPMLNWTDCFK